MAEKLGVKSEPLGEVFYMEVLSPEVHARIGKMEKGQVVRMDRDMALRYLTAGVVKQTTEAAFDKQQDRKATVASRQQEAFRTLNAGYDAWDVSTYRDVLMAPE